MLFQQELKPYALLSHPFYQDWQAGTLSRETLQCYSQQYLHHVNAFPMYLSRIHSQCANLEHRQVLLRNLVDEDGINGTAHPILWEQFAKGLGVTDVNAVPFANTQKLVDTFKALADQSYAAGLGALYAYERQIPEIADTKIHGLKSFYDITDAKTLEFFEVHKAADEWHSEEVANLIAALPEAEQAEAKAASVKAASALWDFLSGIQEARGISCNMQ